jgi:hypothetical protein
MKNSLENGGQLEVLAMSKLYKYTIHKCFIIINYYLSLFRSYKARFYYLPSARPTRLDTAVILNKNTFTDQKFIIKGTDVTQNGYEKKVRIVYVNQC